MTDDMNVINGTWALNPNVTKFKTHICPCGDQQPRGIDFFETYAHVVQWTTVCLMLLIENYLT
ncbi:LOW QUALITY PROTEIN: hypothetical protein ACHAXS_000078 [Conticribra weissflogii]